MTAPELDVLEAVLNLEPNAYCASIYRHLGCKVSREKIYHALAKLEALDCVSSYLGENTAEVGGRGKRFILIKSYGTRTLAAVAAERSAAALAEGSTPPVQSGPIKT